MTVDTHMPPDGSRPVPSGHGPGAVAPRPGPGGRSDSSRRPAGSHPDPNGRRRTLRNLIEDQRVPSDWRNATSLTDLGNVIVRWLSGELPRLPNYLAPVDVDEDIAPGITAALFTANRAGFVTDNSQGGVVWSPTARQLAWVSGIASPGMAQRLAEQARAAGFEAHLWRKGDPRRTVTWDRGQPFTCDGWASPRVLHREVFPDVGPEGRAALDAAQQVSIVDPVPGRNTLWAWLAAACGPETGAGPVAPGTDVVLDWPSLVVPDHRTKDQDQDQDQGTSRGPVRTRTTRAAQHLVLAATALSLGLVLAPETIGWWTAGGLWAATGAATAAAHLRWSR
jgi:hypothetical protein